MSRLPGLLAVIALAAACSGAPEPPAEERLGAQLKEGVAELELSFKGVKEALDAHDYRRAGLAWQRLSRDESSLDEDTGQERNPRLRKPLEVSPGMTLGQWWYERSREYRDARAREAAWAVSALKTGDIPSEGAASFFSDIDEFKNARADLCRARAAAAPGWLRVVFTSNDFDLLPYEAPIQGALREKFGGARKLVFGRPLCDEEAKSTWKTLEVAVEEESSVLSFVSEGRIKRVTSGRTSTVSIPRKVTVTFRASGASGEPTPWDRLGPWQAAADVPAAITEPGQVKTLPAANRQKLSAAIRADLAAIPPFKP